MPLPNIDFLFFCAHMFHRVSLNQGKAPSTSIAEIGDQFSVLALLLP